MVKASEAMSARTRARQAKARLDAQRAEQDRLVLDATTEFYEAAEALTAAQAAAAVADRQRRDAVAKLADLGQADEQIAALCGIGAKDVKDLRRLAAQSTTPGKRSAATPAPEKTPDEHHRADAAPQPEPADSAAA